MDNQVTKSIIINGEVAHLYDRWRDFPSHPEFREDITSVTDEGEDTNRWVMEGPHETKLEWITKTTTLEPNKRIAWKTIAGDLKTSGQVIFTSLPKGQAEVTVTSQTVPPKDMTDEVALRFFTNEAAQLEKDLRRFKTLVEKGSS
jgi:uncharacterized membrane protein